MLHCTYCGRQTGHMRPGFEWINHLFSAWSAGSDNRSDWNCYSNITLKVDMGPYKAGQKFGKAEINVKTGELRFFLSYAEKPSARFMTKLVIESYIDEPLMSGIS